jgi:outer membrane protein
MPAIYKRVLIACFFALPSLAFAADNAAEIKPASLPQTAVSAPAEAAPKPVAAVQTARIGYVDINRIGTESEQGKALKVLLTTKKDKLQVKVDAKKKQIEKLKASIEAKIATMTRRSARPSRKSSRRSWKSSRSLPGHRKRNSIRCRKKRARRSLKQLSKRRWFTAKPTLFPP